MTDTQTTEGLAELEALTGAPITLTAGGKEITIRPLTIGQIAEFSRHIKPIVETMGETLDFESLLNGENVDHAIHAVRIATKQSHQYVQDLNAEEFIRLCRAVWDVNVPFFVRRVAPLLGETAERMMRSAVPGTTQSHVSRSTESATASPH